MTTTDYPSLDGLLAAATPVEAEPFDLEAALTRVRSSKVSIAASGIEQVVRHLNTLRVDTENARRWVDRLQGECAAKDARIAEALRWLDMAASYATSENVAAAIDDARAALRDAE